MEPALSEGVAVRLEIEGRVQGVGYRDWLMRLARHEGLDGWVRNRRDGSVEALLSGRAEAVERIAAACGRGPMLARVEQVRRFSAEPLPEGSGFERRPTG